MKQYLNIFNIFNKYQRDFGEDIHESDFIEWIDEAIEHIGTTERFEEAVAFLEVSNHRADIPLGLSALIQIARNNCWTKDESCLCPKDVIQQVEEVVEENGVAIKCGKPIQHYDIAYYRPYYDTIYEYDFYRDYIVGTSCYTPVRLANHTFFNSLVCKPQDEIYCPDCNDEYTILADVKQFLFSFEEGAVAISYLRKPLDENGYPKIIDDVSIREALYRYVVYKQMEKDFYRGRDGAERKMVMAREMWTKYCLQASNKLKMPNTIDDLEDLMHQRAYLLPRRNLYSNFFGSLGHEEIRRYNNPNYRYKTVNNHNYG